MEASENKLPTPVKSDSRTCFGLYWFATEAEAEAYGAAVGGHVNGGFMDGMPCGRTETAKSWDDPVNGLFAVMIP